MAAQNHKGKIALITGANKGIGYELARQLGKEGVTVLIAARNAELGDAAAGKLKAGGADTYFIEVDLTKPETIAKAAQTVQTRYGIGTKQEIEHICKMQWRSNRRNDVTGLANHREFTWSWKGICGGGARIRLPGSRDCSQHRRFSGVEG